MRLESETGSTFYPLVVVGGGIGGLTFARVVQRLGGEVAVFERDSSPSARVQGGTLDIHPESGQWALIQAGLEHEFKTLARAEGQDMRILSKNGEVLWDEKGREDVLTRPEVDRPALKNILLASLNPKTIRWNHSLVSIRKRGNGTGHVLHFSNGTVITAGLVVGADGAKSRVRPLLTEAQPIYSGVYLIESLISDAESKYPDLARFVGRGSLFALGDNKGIIAQLNGDGRIRVYQAMRVAASFLSNIGINVEDTAAARSAVLSQFADWAPSIVDLIRISEPNFTPWPIYAMPVGITWPSNLDITLLGDAAHQMSPFAGAGANLAMQDGAALAVTLANGESIPASIARYEAEMFKRAEVAARESAEGLEICISPSGAARLAQQMRLSAMES